MLMFSYSHSTPADMPQKPLPNQPVARRAPSQERARQKVELILEAATRIIDQEGLAGLTTNRIAEVAGISIGTLYQYFKNKQQILSTLGEREVRTVTAKMIATLSRPDPSDAADQAQALIRAVFSAFGGRSQVHRILLEHTLAQGNHERLHASPALIANLLTASGIARPDGSRRTLTPAEAFVLTQAFSGVVRASVGQAAKGLPRAQIEEALLRLIQGFLKERDA